MCRADPGILLYHVSLVELQPFVRRKFHDSTWIEGFGDGIEGLFSGHGNRVEEGRRNGRFC